MRPGDQVTWRRKRRGGARTVEPITVTVVGYTHAGRVYVKHTRHGREIISIVEPSNLEPIPKVAVGAVIEA